MKRMKVKVGGLLFVVAVGMAVGCYLLFAPMFSNLENTAYLYIDTDDTEDSVGVKVKELGANQIVGLNLLNSIWGKKELRTGRYGISSGTNALQLFRKLRNGDQTPVKLTIPTVRTVGKLAAFLRRKLMMDSLDVAVMLSDSATCSRYGFTKETMMAMFIPNTYEVYWDVTPENFLKRMNHEYERFWNEKRRALAEKAGLTPVKVATLASIVDEETANDGEKARIAGMYMNRLHADMPLQADPTVKFAWQRFDLKRIWHNLLTLDSPYNTYRNTGLPPGPIRIASVAGIDAVLNYERHDYIYMCAKEDFSGTHNFAVTYKEHQQNARRYTDALNRLKIK